MLRASRNASVHGGLNCVICPKTSIYRSFSRAVRHGSTLSPPSAEGASDPRRTRNIGIIAHIDAGKTTTTERMLYYSGFTRRIGDVDDGSTVTDFLPAERARGITIQSAAVTFHWPPLPAEPASVSKAEISGPRSSEPHTINLIDTPGHADFTFEVLRSLRILDGAVCILDGVAGVEAQTEKVWSQANDYRIPRIVYVNKLDRDGAAFERTVHEIGSRLLGWPAVCQIPWWENGKGRFVGVGDVIALTGMRWGEGGDGKSVKVYTIQELEATDAGLAREIKKARVALIELLSEHDDLMVERYLECEENHLAIPPKEITESLRRCVLDGLGTVVPIFAGASFKNIGVQPLLDAVVDLLPDPRERPEPDITLGAISGSLNQLIDGKLDLAVEPIHDKKRAKRGIAVGTPRNMSLVAGLESCALAFKVVNDLRRGVLVYVRVYSGVIARNASLFNTNLQVSERAPRLLKMYASDAVEISSIPAGQIGVIVGLKHARTGDTLLSYPGVNPRAGPPSPLNLLQLRPIEIPPPVFFASVEPASLSEEKHLGECLSLLLREDPSLQISVDEDSGQTMLNGMGELHLEIARDRLVDDFRAKASMSRVEIGYRETLLEGAGPEHVVFDKEVAGKRGYAGCEASVMPLVDVDLVPETIAHTAAKDGNRITVNLRLPEGPESSTLTPHFPPHLPQSVVFSALVDGAAAALSRGPTHFYPMHSVGVSIKLDPLHDIHGTQTTPAALASATRLATRAALALAAGKPSGTALMEPVMTARISVDEASLGAVVHDLSAARGGHVLSLSTSSPGSSSEADGEVSRARIPPDRIYAPPDPFGPRGEASPTTSAANVPQQRSIVARVPLREMVGYLKHLRSLTGGRGTFVMNVDRFDRVGRQREKALLAELRGF